MKLSKMKSERLLAYYENVRRQVAIDKHAGGEFRFAGEGMKQYTELLAPHGSLARRSLLQGTNL